MDRELTEAEKLTLNNLELLGWKIGYTTKTQWYSNGKGFNTHKDSDWMGDHYLLLGEYEIFHLRRVALRHEELSDSKRGVYGHKYYYGDDWLYLTPNGRITRSYDEACRITVCELGLGLIEGSEYEAYKRSKNVEREF